MASLAGNFLNLGSLLDGLSELGIVKNHLFRASREILLAVQGLLGFADQYLSGTPIAQDQQQIVRAAISYAQKTLRTIVQQLPRGDEDEYRSLHRKVMSSILEVLEGEIRTNARRSGQKAKMKGEVLDAIRKVLLREMYEQDMGKEEAPPASKDAAKSLLRERGTR